MLELLTVGSIAYKLARTASGMADGTWSRGEKYEWDICAGVLLIEEGGGRCVNLDDEPFLFNQGVIAWPKVNGTGSSRHGPWLGLNGWPSQPRLSWQKSRRK